MRFIGVAVCVLGVLWCPGAAGAAVVRAGTAVVDPAGLPSVAAYAVLVGDGRDADAVTVVADGAGVIFRDQSATLAVGSGCVALDANTARCEVLGVETGLGIGLDLGAGDDRYVADPSMGPPTVRAGDGADVIDLSASQPTVFGTGLWGGGGDDVLIGSPGPDSIDDGSGADRVSGGGGADSLIGAAGHDQLDGGADSDSVAWAGGGPVRVDLADRGPDGPRGAEDALTSIERVSGGRGSVILGGPGPESLEAFGGLADGRGGDDLISGRGSLAGGSGNDQVMGEGRLSGGTGNDLVAGGRVLEGGPGDDDLRWEEESGPGAVRCGGGADRLRLLRIPATPRLRPACERIDIAGLLIAAWQLSRRTLTLRIGTSGSLGLDRCRTRLRSGATTTSRLRLRRRPRTVVLPAARHRATLRVLDGRISACSGLGSSRLRIRFAR